MNALMIVSRAVLAFAALCGLAATPAHADSWAMPGIETYVSANGRYRLTVVPREIGSQLAYFDAKVRGETLPEPEGPSGRFEKRDGAQWVPVWSRTLVNEVAPVEALVSDDGQRVVTFDNWHSVGHGDHVLVLYGAEGALVRSLRLDEIVPAYFIDGIPASVSSIHWRRGEPHLVGPGLELRVSGPRSDIGSGDDDGFPVRVSLADGSVEAIAPALMAELGPQMCAAHVESVASFNAYLADEHSDLVSPASRDRDDWRRYQYQAVERTKPRGATDEAAEKSSDPFASILDETVFELLGVGDYMEKDFRDGFRGALIAPLPEMRRRWFASLDQGAMVTEIERTAKKIKPGRLQGVEMRFLADAAHWPRIRHALAASGATLVQLDTGVPIPPHPDDLAQLPPERTIDPACTGR